LLFTSTCGPRARTDNAFPRRRAQKPIDHLQLAEFPLRDGQRKIHCRSYRFIDHTSEAEKKGAPSGSTFTGPTSAPGSPQLQTAPRDSLCLQRCCVRLSAPLIGPPRPIPLNEACLEPWKVIIQPLFNCWDPSPFPLQVAAWRNIVPRNNLPNAFVGRLALFVWELGVFVTRLAYRARWKKT